MIFGAWPAVSVSRHPHQRRADSLPDPKESLRPLCHQLESTASMCDEQSERSVCAFHQLLSA